MRPGNWPHSSKVHSLAAVVVVDLRSDPDYQNQQAALPLNNGGSFSHNFSIAGIEVGSGTFSLNFSLTNALSETGNIIERDAKIEAIADMVHPLYNPGLLAFGEDVWINDSLGWNNENRNVGILRYIQIIEPPSTSNAGEFNDGIEKFAGFRLQDGADYYYGYLQMRVSDYPDHPAISIAGYAIETTANQAIQTAAIPEPGTASLAVLAAFLLLLHCKKKGWRNEDPKEDQVPARLAL